MKPYLILLTLIVFSSATQASAKLRVVTTLPSYADIAHNVGGDDIDVISLTKGTQDPHFVDAKPDLILKLAKADLLIRAGLELETGWLPPLQVGSRNGKIQDGSEGNLDLSTVVNVLEVPRGKIDRSMGDVHPGGNPHFMLDPRNGVLVANAIAERLGKLDASKVAEFQKRADTYVAELKKHILAWTAELKPFAGTPIVTYHKSWVYFSNFAGLKEEGYIEPKPGIPPSPDHVVRMIGLMKQRKIKLILMEPYYPKGTAEEVAKEVGARLLILPTEVDGNPQAKTYFGVFDEIIKGLKKP